MKLWIAWGDWGDATYGVFDSEEVARAVVARNCPSMHGRLQFVSGSDHCRGGACGITHVDLNQEYSDPPKEETDV